MPVPTMYVRFISYFTLFRVFHTPVHLCVAKLWQRFHENWPEGHENGFAFVRKIRETVHSSIFGPLLQGWILEYGNIY